MRTLIQNATIVNEGRTFHGYLLIDDDRITDIQENEEYRGGYDTVVDASDCFVLPGVIDDHVHFRDPGLTHKADIHSESRAAAYGGVTSYLDMPNTVPQTTTLEALEQKYQHAAEDSAVNYGFFFGATNDNAFLFPSLDPHRVPGIKLFMGSSTGNMLVDREEALRKIFREAPLPVMVHCEDTTRINERMREAKVRYGDDPPVWTHPRIRDEEACYRSTSLAVQLAETYGTTLHVAHVSTADELSLFGTHKNITAEAVVAHLLFSSEDYSTSGTRIKCNPSIKSPRHREALRKALTDGRITTIGTDHAPHLLSEKAGGAARAVSGMPMIQFSLVSMLQLVDEEGRRTRGKPIVVEFLVAKGIQQAVGIVDVFGDLRKMITVVAQFDLLEHLFRRIAHVVGHGLDVLGKDILYLLLREATDGRETGQQRHILQVVDG